MASQCCGRFGTRMAILGILLSLNGAVGTGPCSDSSPTIVPGAEFMAELAGDACDDTANGGTCEHTCAASHYGGSVTCNSANSNYDNLCSTGIDGGEVCCAAQCTVCADTGCEDSPGGEDQCCGSGIASGGNVCNDVTDEACSFPTDGTFTVVACTGK